jgi:N,N'-diacetyllegionaminate synthase|tara:strand:+ start:1127 stop:2152 length:1026 start_codon:yes stop_codon:yes gene_type:complete
MNRIFKNIPYFIAEIGVNHNGDMNLAKKMIIAAKKSGANAVKFQTFKASTLVTPRTPKVKYQKSTTNKNESHYQMIKSLELSEKNHLLLKNFCKKKKIEFLSTPYDINSAKFLNKIGCKVFKTASADIVDLELHEYLAKKNKNVIISTGMSTFKEIDECINIYRKYSNKKFVLLHCVSNYPCSLKSLNLKILPIIKNRYKCQVGYSDHSVGNEAATLSYSLGAKVFEKHFTTNKSLKGPDQKASSLPEEFKEMVFRVKQAETILGKPIKKCQNEEFEMSKVSRKSITVDRDLKKGETLKRGYLLLKRPGTGLYYKYIEKIIGKKIKNQIAKNYQIKLSDVY